MYRVHAPIITTWFVDNFTKLVLTMQLIGCSEWGRGMYHICRYGSLNGKWSECSVSTLLDVSAYMWLCFKRKVKMFALVEVIKLKVL